MRQTNALPVSEKHQMQFIHSLAEPRPPGSALRKRSNIASGPRSLVARWLRRNVASDPKIRMNQSTCPDAYQVQPRRRKIRSKTGIGIPNSQSKMYPVAPPCFVLLDKRI